MDKPIENYWKTRLADLKEALDANNFEAFVANNANEAQTIVLEKIIPKTAPKSVSWGGSLTFIATKLYDTLKHDSNLMVLDTFDKNLLLKKVWSAAGSRCWSIFLSPEATR